MNGFWMIENNRSYTYKQRQTGISREVFKYDLKNDLINWVLTLKSNGKFDTQWKPLTAVGLDRNIDLLTCVGVFLNF
jgi:hypothetical protein